jgi:hypothetical protein
MRRLTTQGTMGACKKAGGIPRWIPRSCGCRRDIGTSSLVSGPPMVFFLLLLLAAALPSSPLPLCVVHVDERDAFVRVTMLGMVYVPAPVRGWGVVEDSGPAFGFLTIGSFVFSAFLRCRCLSKFIFLCLRTDLAGPCGRPWGWQRRQCSGRRGRGGRGQAVQRLRLRPLWTTSPTAPN